MKAALLEDRGVVKVVGDDARNLLNGLMTADIGRVAPDKPCFAALLTPQGKIVTDAIVAEAPQAQGGGFFLDVPAALAPAFVSKLNFYKLRAKATVEDLSATLGVMAAWDGKGESGCGLCVHDPRFAALGLRIMLPPQHSRQAADELGADLVDAADYEAHRIGLAIPRGGIDFIYGDAFPHEADMDQLNGVDFSKGCFIGQEVVSRMEHRGTVRSRIVPVAYEGAAPAAGAAIMAGDHTVGTFGSCANGRGLAMVRLDRVADALAAGHALLAGTTKLHVLAPDWAQFPIPRQA